MTLAGEEAETDPPAGVVAIGVDEHDALPGAEQKPAGNHRQGERGRDQERQDVVGAMAGGPVAMPVPLVAWQEPGKQLGRVGLTAGPRFHQGESGGGMRGEHVEEPVAPARAVALGRLGQVRDRLVAGVESDLDGVHGASSGYNVAMTSERDREAESEAEIERQAAHEPDDPTTRREELELELMEEDESEEGEEIGEHLE